MEQLNLFAPTTDELLSLITKLKTELTDLRKGVFYRIGEIKKDHDFLETQVEIVVRNQIQQIGE